MLYKIFIIKKNVIHLTLLILNTLIQKLGDIKIVYSQHEITIKDLVQRIPKIHKKMMNETEEKGQKNRNS